MRSPGFREYPGRLTDDFQALADLLDIGEAEALSIAQELGAVALIDEQRGRKVAVNRGIAITGTAGVLVMAKRTGEIRALKPLLEELAIRGYRFSEKLVRDVLDICGE
jgi:predicted nucleic acid-binding protein